MRWFGSRAGEEVERVVGDDEFEFIVTFGYTSRDYWGRGSRTRYWIPALTRAVAEDWVEAYQKSSAYTNISYCSNRKDNRKGRSRHRDDPIWLMQDGSFPKDAPLMVSPWGPFLKNAQGRAFSVVPPDVISAMNEWNLSNQGGEAAVAHFVDQIRAAKSLEEARKVINQACDFKRRYWRSW